jgi:hypothetical protein
LEYFAPEITREIYLCAKLKEGAAREERVREAAVAPEAGVADAEVRSDDIKSANNGARSPNRLDALGNFGEVETASD